MVTLTLYAPGKHAAYHNPDRDVINHALQSEQFVTLECGGYWNFYVKGVPTDKATFCQALGKQISDNGGKWITVDDSDWSAGYKAIAVGCQYYCNVLDVADGNNAGALFAFVCQNEHTDKGDKNMTKNFEMLKRLMKAAKDDAFLTAAELPEGVYEATLDKIVENDKRTMFIFALTSGKVAMTFGNDETGLSFLAQALVRLGVDADTPTFEGLRGTKVVLNIKHDDSGEYIRARIAAVVGKGAVSTGAAAPAERAAAAPVTEEVGEEFDLALVSEGDSLRVQFGEEEKIGTLVSIDGDSYVINVDDSEYAFTADMILGKEEEVVSAPPPPPPPPPPARGKPAAGKPAAGKPAAAPAAAAKPPARTPAKPAVSKMKHAVGDNVVVELEGKKYRSVISGIEDGQYVAKVKGDEYLLTDDHIVG